MAVLGQFVFDPAVDAVQVLHITFWRNKLAGIDVVQTKVDMHNIPGAGTKPVIDALDAVLTGSRLSGKIPPTVMLDLRQPHRFERGLYIKTIPQGRPAAIWAEDDKSSGVIPI